MANLHLSSADVFTPVGLCRRRGVEPHMIGFFKRTIRCAPLSNLVPITSIFRHCDNGSGAVETPSVPTLFVSLMSPFTSNLSSFRYVNRSLNVLLAHLRGQIEHCTPCTLGVGLACTCIPSVFSNSLSTAAHLDYYLG